MYFYHDILWPAIKATKCLVWNSDIQGSFKKFSLLFGQAETIFVIVCFFDHFTLKTIPSVNGICMVAFVNHLHVWLTKFKPSFIFFKLSVLTSNNVIWVNFSAILFDETQHVVKTSTTSCAPVCYETINLFIGSQNFLLMGLICKLKDLYLIIFFFNGWGKFSNLSWQNCFYNPLYERFGLRLFTTQEKAIKAFFFQ